MFYRVINDLDTCRALGIYCKFRCKSDPVIRNSDPEKRRTFTQKIHISHGTLKNDLPNRMIQLSVSQSNGVYYIHSEKVPRKKISEKQWSFTVIVSPQKNCMIYATRNGFACGLFLLFFFII